MEALMSNIMQSAVRDKRPAEDLPLDLTQPKLLRHTCDSFVDDIDIRAGSDSNVDLAGDSTPNNRPSFHTVSCSTANITPVRKELKFGLKDEGDIKKSTPHAFSIEALLGDTTVSKQFEQSTPAIVYNVHTTRTPRTTNVDTSCNYKPITNTINWCHACNSFCADDADAQGHQNLHYMQGIKCDLKKEMKLKYGYVTKHFKVNDENVQCSFCAKTVAFCFFSKHQRNHNYLSCDICNKEFLGSIHLQDHMNVHIGNTPFSCKFCNRKFTKRSSLTQHQRYHRDNERFKCAYCYKSFNNKYTRVVHERLHTGEKPFKCKATGCTKAFPQKIQLQLHMNSHTCFGGSA